jgi:hypothetical protein
MADVRLVDLDVFKRYSLAIRQESAPMEELLSVLDATRAQVEAAGRSPGRTPRRKRATEAASDDLETWRE